MSYVERISDSVADLLVREGLDYNQTKAVFKA
ncbi:MAG: integrase, partial [Rubrobacteraceae bacterium]|nr:integrase [Rubrobacteraceae bacterium]